MAAQCTQAYESLAILEATSTMAQRALESNSKLKGNDSRNISAYFNKVRLDHTRLHAPRTAVATQAAEHYSTL